MSRPIRLFDRLSTLSDERLARLVGRGHERALSIVYVRYHRSLYEYCRSVLLNDADAQDALQAAFERALIELRAGRRDVPLRPWLFRLAHEETSSVLLRCEFDGLCPPEQEASSEEKADERARVARLVADLLDLPERQRAALVMRELSGLSHEEIALALGISRQATSHAIFEARRSLEDCELGRSAECGEMRLMISEHDGRAWRLRRIRAHLRDCVQCSAFAASIPARRSDLRAISPPIGPLLAIALLRRLFRAASATSGGAAGTAGVATGTSVLAATVSTKALSAVAVVAVAAGGAGAIEHPPGRADTPAARSAQLRGDRTPAAKDPTTALRPGTAAPRPRNARVPALRVELTELASRPATRPIATTPASFDLAPPATRSQGTASPNREKARTAYVDGQPAAQPPAETKEVPEATGAAEPPTVTPTNQPPKQQHAAPERSDRGQGEPRAEGGQQGDPHAGEERPAPPEGGNGLEAPGREAPGGAVALAAGAQAEPGASAAHPRQGEDHEGEPAVGQPPLEGE